MTCRQRLGVLGVDVRQLGHVVGVEGLDEVAVHRIDARPHSNCTPTHVTEKRGEAETSERAEWGHSKRRGRGSGKKR